MKPLIKKYILYLLRWQLSTPTLAIVFIILAGWNKWLAAAIANFIGGIFFFWVDKWIFEKRT